MLAFKKISAKKLSKSLRFFLLISCFLSILVACQEKNEPTAQGDFNVTEYSGETLRIVAGSENKELEPIIKAYANKNKVNITMDYLGSLDIMRLLQSGELDYDAVWPASSIWLNMGDQHHLLKHTATTSITPVVFGIKQSLAEELGFVDKDVYIADIIEAIKADKLNFAMTSATQSNSGASAYLGFLTAIAKSQGGFTLEDLNDEANQSQIKDLLSGVNRSSGSSNWLVDLFLQADYDAMVNYETLIIQTNQELLKQKREPLYIVYPVDGLALSDSPLAYVDHNQDKIEDMFLDFQEYLLSEEAQLQIEATGKRSRTGSVAEKNRSVFNKDWGIDVDKQISSIRWPSAEVIQEALNLYQTQFKKPALTAYVLDYSGSMEGEGNKQMTEAMAQVLLPENAKANLLQGTQQDISLVIPFSDMVDAATVAKGNGQELVDLNQYVQDYVVGGDTAMYEGIIAALDTMVSDYGQDLEDYSPAIVILTDGQPNGAKTFKDLSQRYQQAQVDIPMFSILFGEAEEGKMKEIADLTKARVFDGRKDLINAFKQVKGYN
ncbi:substrate-binding and vWA domain-containing protein [Eremococcus coleocola]|uniref:von Willebrand factor type A domain protein n=1 Tax=Eremococcus coleocola ACS-139-V-Col8 TaxID=908337 RepID=E4KNN1_9LACT|nr:substrate-binding and VWA domain-containing protein [Eremococcus coleocola]EFR31433.1 von Willebrand factor type A domain protein [Eremococcus coleocola ACS-139-V-Col8]